MLPRLNIPVPISLQHDFPFSTVGEGTTLWRFLKGQKFESILETKQLWFTRVDAFIDDELEGRKPAEAALSPGEAALFKAYNIEKWDEQYPGARDEQRGCFFASCWHMNPKESARMWQEYTRGCPDSVALVSSLKRRVRPPNHVKSR